MDERLQHLRRLAAAGDADAQRRFDIACQRANLCLCGNPSTAQCSRCGYRVDSNCSSQCFECGTIYCRNCELLCGECARLLCNASEHEISSITHVRFCERDPHSHHFEPRCLEHLYTCDFCSILVSNNCVTECILCEQTVCIDCVEYCCDTQMCPDCSIEHYMDEHPEHYGQ